MDIKHSHFYNGKRYFFLTFPFFGSKIQHFSTFGSNQDDHGISVLNQSEEELIKSSKYITDRILGVTFFKVGISSTSLSYLNEFISSFPDRSSKYTNNI